MPVPSVELSGPALRGVAPHVSGRHAMTALAPETVRLGRRPPRYDVRKRLRLLHFEDYLQSREPIQLPEKVDYYTNAAPSISRMYKNDEYGDCVIAGKYHAMGAWTANDPDHTPAGVLTGTDDEVLSAYHSICGAGDNGCIITDVLQAFQKTGLKFNGQNRKIDGFVAVDWTKRDLVRASIYLFGALTIGVNLPDAWTSSDVWDTTSTQIVGGHDVTCVGFDTQGVQIASWARIYTITWRAFLSTRWLEEAYAMLAPDWYGADQKASAVGLDVTGLKADLATLGHGQVPTVDPIPVPPGPTPTPPVPPVPPAEQGIHLCNMNVAKTIKKGSKFRMNVVVTAPENIQPGTYEVVALPQHEYTVQVEEEATN